MINRIAVPVDAQQQHLLQLKNAVLWRKRHKNFKPSRHVSADNGDNHATPNPRPLRQTGDTDPRAPARWQLKGNV
jgi:hypothetical protein